MNWGLKGGISIDADSGPPRYVLWCCGGICHQLPTFFKIGCGHTVLRDTFVRENLEMLNSLNFIAVRRKWKKYGRYIYYTGLISYFVFLLFLTSFALLSPNASDLLNSTKQTCIDHSKSYNNESNKKSMWMYISQYGIIGLSSLQLILELIQAFRVNIFYKIINCYLK